MFDVYRGVNDAPEGCALPRLALSGGETFLQDESPLSTAQISVAMALLEAMGQPSEFPVAEWADDFVPAVAEANPRKGRFPLHLAATASAPPALVADKFPEVLLRQYFYCV